MEKRKVIIIGSGLGGLSTAVILAKSGFKVTVFEKEKQIGGCLQCFKRGNAKFETGMHFLGSAKEGQTLDKILNFLEVKKDLKLFGLDPTGYEIISFRGQKYKFASQKEPFINQMCEYFPSERYNLEKYFSLIEEITQASPLHSLQYSGPDIQTNMKYRFESVNSVLDNIFSDDLIKEVLVGNMPLYAAQKDKTPFSTHAYVMNFYNADSSRIVGGSDSIAFSMKKTIEKYGGEVLASSCVTDIVCQDLKSTGVIVNDSEFYPSDYVISDLHPASTVKLIGKPIRPAFRNRINTLPQTPGVFSIYIEFKENTMPYMNYNFYGYNKENTVWDCEKYTLNSWPECFLYMHFCQIENPKYAHTGVILAYMRFSEVEKWSGTHVGNRGKDYENFKKLKAEKLLETVEKQVPGLRNCIKNYYTSTPLTYLDYTGTKDGSMYGVAKDVNLGPACRIPHRTRVSNVFQAGQNVNAHGMLGVLVGTVITCSELLTPRKMFELIN